MIWSQYSGGNVRLYEGRETKEGAGPVYIKVSYAAKRHNKSNWISYKFPKDVDFFEALKKGVKGQRTSGSYKQTCIIKMRDYGFIEINTPQKKRKSLHGLKSSQQFIINRFSQFSFQLGSAYNFNPDSIQLAAPKLGDAQNSIQLAAPKLGDAQTCYIANKSPNAQWSAEKIKDAVREVRNRGLDCLESKPTSSSEPAEKIMQASGSKRDSKEQRLHDVNEPWHAPNSQSYEKIALKYWCIPQNQQKR